MSTLIVIHSYKGGTGKSLLSLNVAGYLAKSGKKVAILDFDFLGPSMFTVFGEDKNFLNDVIYGNHDILDVLIEFSHPELKDQQLYAGVANPEPSAINRILQMGEKEFKNSFEKTMEIRDIIEDDLGVDYIIVDTGPGLRLDSANAIVIADYVSLVLKPTTADLYGTKKLINSMIKAYSSEKNINIILNRALDTNWQIESSLPIAQNDYFNLKQELESFSKEAYIPIFATIPCICDISRSQSDRIIVLDYPSHPFSQKIKELCSNYLNY
jgi:MinD-like ATPase involved in chromosome partitioning or flagellar assembly